MSTLTRRVLRVPAFVWVLGGMALGAVLLGRHRDDEAAKRAAASLMAPPALVLRPPMHSMLPAHPLAAAAAPAPPLPPLPSSPAADLSYLSTLHPAGAAALK
jgi:hypothetical protein